VSTVPAGFERLDAISPFHDLVGPLYLRREADAFSVGMIVAEKHLNSRGIVHGGMICTLVDFAMGYAARFASDPPRALVTTNLSVDFAGNARIGDWIGRASTCCDPAGRSRSSTASFTTTARGSRWKRHLPRRQAEGLGHLRPQCTPAPAG
jgi:uncharacterized protein (TIGR00369 family)